MSLATREIEVELPDLHAGQAEIYRSPARFRIAIMGRRFGKTTVGSVTTLDAGPEPFDGDYGRVQRRRDAQVRSTKAALRRAAFSGGRILWVAPVYYQARIGWRLIREMAEQIPGAAVEKSSMTVEFPGGGTVTAKSAHDPDRMRGEGWDGVVLEEVAQLKPTVWPNIIRPALADRQGWALMIGTPRGNNWLKRLWDWCVLPDGTIRPGWARFQKPTWSNPVIPPEEIVLAREDTPEMIFQQEYGAVFIDTQGKQFRAEWFRYFLAEKDERDEWWVHYTDIHGKLHSYRLRHLRRWAAVDPALSEKRSADWTAVAVGAQTPAGHLLVLRVYRFKREQPDLLDQLVQIYRRWGLEYMGIEHKSIGIGVFQQLSRTPNVVALPIDMKGDKVEKSIAVANRMRAGGVYFDAAGAAWLRDFELELLWFPPEAGDEEKQHDDQADALAMLDHDRFMRRSGGSIRTLED